MQLQVALDRLPLDKAVQLARQVQPYADLLEIGTSLIKEFGMESVRRMRAELPSARILADLKINDEARYEAELAYKSGADIITVMGAAPDATIKTCLDVAGEQGKQVLIDMLGTDEARQKALLAFREAILGVHASKDVREVGGNTSISLADRLPDWILGHTVAVAGGVTLEDIPALGRRQRDLIVIVGSAITGAKNPVEAARSFAETLKPYR